ncbi:MAG: phosphoglycerate mutase [Luteimonas sp.]
MPRAMPGSATLLLPARKAFAGRDLPRDVAVALARGDAVEGEPGDAAQLQRHFALLPRGWPVAALTRAVDAADAAGAQWLRADPAWVRPDINGARLFAAGESMGLAREDADALLPALRPLFGDAGMPIDAPHPSRWYLRVAPGVPLPAFPDPGDALGSDLGDAIVEAGGGAGPDARRWRALLSEAQVVLHNHPWNARRAAQGKPPVNSLWFWGGGALPDRVTTSAGAVRSDDALLGGLALRAGAAHAPLPPRFDAVRAEVLFDLRGLRDFDALAGEWLLPAVDAAKSGALGALQLDFADGGVIRLARGQRWRFWRRPDARLA